MYACTLAGREVRELKGLLGTEDMSAALRSPEKLELLRKLTDAELTGFGVQ